MALEDQLIRYHIFNVQTGQRTRRVFPLETYGATARATNDLTASLTFPLRSNIEGGREMNPNVGMLSGLFRWRHGIAVSWQPAGTSTPILIAAWVITGWPTDEREGTVTLDLVDVRGLLAKRFIHDKTTPFTTKKNTATKVTHGPSGVIACINRAIQNATTNYPEINGYGLPIDYGTEDTGTVTATYYGYQFRKATEAVDDLADRYNRLVDFNPRWVLTGGTYYVRWTVDVWATSTNRGTLRFNPPGVDHPQAVLNGTADDGKGMATTTHHTGKGSEVDILYARRSDPNPAIPLDGLFARPDTEAQSYVTEQANTYYEDAKATVETDDVTMFLAPTVKDRDRWGWYDPSSLAPGKTVHLPVRDSIRYGTTTLERVLIGWEFTSPNSVRLDLNPIRTDGGA